MIRLKIKPSVSFIYCVSLMILMPVALRAQLDPTAPRSWLFDVYSVTVYRLDTIALGVLAAAMSVRFSSSWVKYKNSFFVLGVVIIALDWWILTDSVINPRGFMLVWHFLFCGLGCTLLLPMFSQLKNLRLSSLDMATANIANWSYAIYLIHMPVLNVFKKVFSVQIKESLASSWYVLAIVLLNTIVISALLHHYFEKPLMNLRDRLKFNQKDEVLVAMQKA